MSALNQLIVIVNLLYNRNSVSIKSIREVCGISERTAYRYIDKISRAGIPLYFDRDQGGYTLCRYAKLPLNHLDINEIIIIIVALIQLSNRIDGYYHKAVENLLKKIESSGEIALEEIIGLLESNRKENCEGERLNQLITSSLIQAAVRLKTKTNIFLNRDGQLRDIILEHPKLEFKKRWKVVSIKENSRETVPLSQIVGIHIKTLSEKT
ncbi:MAG: hypothetical protein DRP51_01900 [Candidatus Zixiibacteriota bacterium]|nr:MAG: hypothetical protein DRP51_01900 [candidate division Zixibacteria bacterium]